jgi:hypothetical protein
MFYCSVFIHQSRKQVLQSDSALSGDKARGNKPVIRLINRDVHDFFSAYCSCFLLSSLTVSARATVDRALCELFYFSSFIHAFSFGYFSLGEQRKVTSQ